MSLTNFRVAICLEFAGTDREFLWKFEKFENIQKIPDFLWKSSGHPTNFKLEWISIYYFSHWETRKSAWMGKKKDSKTMKSETLFDKRRSFLSLPVKLNLDSCISLNLYFLCDMKNVWLDETSSFCPFCPRLSYQL